MHPRSDESPLRHDDAAELRDDVLAPLREQLRRLRERVLEAEEEHRGHLDAVPEAWRESARNLVHYLGLRRHDIRPLQIELGFAGLSSLGRLEAHVLAGIDSVLYALDRIVGVRSTHERDRPEAKSFRDGDNALIQHTEELLGPAVTDRVVRVMVTLPSVAASDYGLVRDLMRAGMSVARINSAHDDTASWEAMIQHVRRAESETGQRCRVLFDLCGPKLRTGDVQPRPGIEKLRPARDERGFVVAPATVWIGSGPPPADREMPAVVPVDDDFASLLEGGDEIQLTDLPGRSRRILVVAADARGGAWGHARQTTYVAQGLELRLVRDGTQVAAATVGEIPSKPGFLSLSVGDELCLTRPGFAGQPASLDDAAATEVTQPARIPCAAPEVFRDVADGDPILFDDGKFAGTVTSASEHELLVRIDRAPPRGAKLRAGNGINLPRSRLSAPPLTEEDLANLDFAASRVDLVGQSFVRTPDDLARLQRELARRGATDVSVILKIENRAAFENLPELLLAGLRHPPFGVMVARGDLGVEVGFERLAEVQEQILWLCEAAHCPVIWATQVLENMVKKGMPTRAEVTDAAMSGRAECVMLNKGPYIVETVRFLDGILTRMRDHHHKKTPMLRRLKVSEGRFRAPLPDGTTAPGMRSEPR